MTHRPSLAFLAVLLLLPGAVHAQRQVRTEILHTPNGEILDFAPDGGWRNRAREVATRRWAMRQRGDFRSMNAPMAFGAPFPAQAAVTGTKRIPAILFRFADVGTGPNLPASAGDTSRYTQVMFGATAPVGRPYSIRTFYEQMSNNLISLQGQVIGWVTLSGNEVSYTGDAADVCSGNPFGGANATSCNGLFSGSAVTKMRTALNEAITAVDTGTYDWGQFDNDGPDGNPNSGDDNGVVDQMIFVHSELDGACGPAGTVNNHLWSHRSAGINHPTHTSWAGHPGQFIRVRDYTLQSGVGGSNSCNTGQIMPVGTAAHETGHAFGLPDLYDTQGPTEGVGQWGLMGSGNYTTALSPTRMEAWSLEQLGWVTITQITTTGTYSISPAASAHTAYLIRLPNPNPRGEYYLIENRQAVLADTGMINKHCTTSGLSWPSNCHGGLAIWHIDSTTVKNKGFGVSNSVNAGVPTPTNPHGVMLVQADGLSQLEKPPTVNRGNAGDVWPGYGAGTPNPAGTAGLPLSGNGYTLVTNPKAVANDSISSVGFQIDLIQQTVLDGDMSFRVQFGSPTIVRATDTLAKVTVDGADYGRFANILQNASSHTISMPSTQVTTDGRSRFTFVSWSDGLGQSHSITGSVTGDSISANVTTEYKIQAVAAGTGTGTVGANPTVADLTNGTFVAKNSAMQLTATLTGSSIFDHWSDSLTISKTSTTSSANPLNLTMTQPHVVTAFFAGILAINSGSPPAAVMGKTYSFPFTVSGGNGTNAWSVLSGSLPSGMVLNPSTGVLSGIPTAAGPFNAVVRAVSGTQNAQSPITIAVGEPTLVLNSVLPHLLGTGTALTTDEVKYLDLIGNNNGGYDVGDFLAWVNKTGANPASAPALPAPSGPKNDGTVTP